MSGASRGTGSLLSEGPEGYWIGTFTAYTHQPPDEKGVWLLTGHAAYERLSAMLTTTQDRSGRVEVDSIVFAGPLPKLPEPLELSTE